MKNDSLKLKMSFFRLNFTFCIVIFHFHFLTLHF